MNNVNNTNQTNNQNVIPNITVSNDTTNQGINVANDTNTVSTINDMSVLQQPSELQTVTNVSPVPKVVKIENVKETVKEVESTNGIKAAKGGDGTVDQTDNQTISPEINEMTVKKKNNPIGTVLLILFIIFLFAFVYFLPEISQFIEDYKRQKSGVEDGSMKSGTMTCTLTRDNNDNLSTIYETTFTYTKNKLKKTEQVISYKLKDDATSTVTLDESENECQNLKSALSTVSGIDISCSKTAVLQKTTQVIDYTKFDVEQVTTNIAEYNGFYPEYQLDQSIASIKKNLEEAGYSCQAREY
mgnify:FL=1